MACWKLFFSDQGKAYESELLKEFLDILDVHKLRTTAYYPQCDRQSEKFTRVRILHSGAVDNRSKTIRNDVWPDTAHLTGLSFLIP